MKSTVQRSARTFFFWVSLVPVILALLSFWAAVRYQNSIELVLHTKDVLVSVQEIRASANKAASLHEFVSLTGHTSGREDYLASWARVQSEIAVVQRLTADNLAQRANSERLSQAAVSLRTTLDAILQRRSELKTDGVLVPLETFAVDIRLIAKFRKICADMIAEENKLLRIRLESQREIGKYLALCFVLGIASCVALLMKAYQLIGRYEMQRDEAEAGIRSLNSELEERVNERTADLQRVNADLLRSNTDLTQFAYVASHDLQEPLRTVGSYASLLARRYEGKLDAQADQYIRFVVEGASRMQTLVRDLLAYSRVGTQPLRLAPVDMGQVVATVSESLRVSLVERNALVTCDVLPTIVGDAARLGQVYLNLLGNALKFSKPGEQPQIHIGAVCREGDWHFSVRDNGIGFESAYAERIFVIFQRLHRVGAYPGTGIGLAVCKRIVEAHGGKIWATSEPGNGSTFSFTISNNVTRNGTNRDKPSPMNLTATKAPEETGEEIPGEAANAHSASRG